MAVEQQSTKKIQPDQERPVQRQTVLGTADGYELNTGVHGATLPTDLRVAERIQPGGQPLQRP